MSAKVYSSFFFPEVNQPTSPLSGRSFLSFDNADSIRDDDERSVFTAVTSTTMSSFFPGSLSNISGKSGRTRPTLPALETRHTPSRSSSHPSLRPIPQAKPAPKANLPVPPPPFPYSAPPERTQYQHIGTRHYTSPSKPPKTKKKHAREHATFVPPSPPSPPPSPLARRMSASTVSTNCRKVSRAHALASLEGHKTQSAGAIVSAPPQHVIPLNARSFIALSDEHDEDYDPDLESEADDPTLPRQPKQKTRRRRRTIDSWFIGPPPSPSPSSSSTAPSFITHDSDESFESPRPSLSSTEPFQVPQRGQFIDFDDIVDPEIIQQFEYDAWAVVGEKRPEWLKAALE